MQKIIFLFITLIVLMGCGGKKANDDATNSNGEKYQNELKTKWQGDDGWYISKDGNYHGKYEGWYRYSISIPSENTTETIIFPNGYQKDISTSLVIESYKKNKNSTKISRELFFEKFGNKNAIKTLSISFNDKPFKEYKTITKYNIQIHFDKEDIPVILDELKNAKTFAISYEGKKAKFKNVDYEKNFIE